MMTAIVFLLWAIVQAVGVNGFTALKINDCSAIVIDNDVLSTVSLQAISNDPSSNYVSVNDGGVEYYYTPCGSLSISGACSDVSVCQFEGVNYFDLGSPSTVAFGHTGDRPTAQYISTNANPDGNQRQSTVELVCDTSNPGGGGVLEYVNEGPTLEYNLRYHSADACPVEGSHGGEFTVSSLSFCSALVYSNANGLQLVDISPLDSTFTASDGFHEYSYSPCTVESFGGACVGVFLCQEGNDIGDDSFVLFGHNGENVVVHYRSSNTNSDGFDRNTFITFVCDMSVETGDFRYISEGPVLTYVFELHTKYACPQDYNECATSNGGCSQNCDNTDGSFQCSCNNGYLLDSDEASCNDIDECSNSNGGCNQMCNNTEGSFMCSCANGYELESDGLTCTDTDECSNSNGGCNQICNNTEGSFMCSCANGYELESDGLTCTDTDECSNSNGGCNQICNNTEGSFMCSCANGYELESDGLTCTDIDECSNSNGGCNQMCNNTEGSLMCSCANGYELESDGLTCTDIDECSISNGGCNQMCNNTEGSFMCSCANGYELESDGLTCTDTDECSNSNSGCNQICNNTEGSFMCSCANGYELESDGLTCTDTDECSNSNGGCNQICNNTEGSFMCSCDNGYELESDGLTCTDTDECMDNNGGCSQREECINTEGSFFCICIDGYTLASDNETCVDIDECLMDNGGCSYKCNNTEGGFYCLCEDGYILSSDNRTCIDVDECSTNNGGCHQICNNTEGGFFCSCDDGYALRPDNLTCAVLPPQLITQHKNQSDLKPGSTAIFNVTAHGVQPFIYMWFKNGALFDNDKVLVVNESSLVIRNVSIEDEGLYSCLVSNIAGNVTSFSAELTIDKCSPENGGCSDICVNIIGSTYCSCSETGYSLDTDGATCLGYLDCSLDMCENGGTCTEMSNRCNCVEGYIGRYCEGVAGCDVTPCQNGGSCAYLVNGNHSCFCPDKFHGHYCEIERLLTNTQIILIASLGGAFLIAVVLLFIIIGCCCIFKKRSKEVQQDQVELDPMKTRIY